MKRITISSRMTWTEGGVWGCFLFVLAPIAGAFAWRWYVSALLDRARGHSLSESAAVEVAATLSFASGLAFLVGCLLVFYGRAYTHEVAIGEERPISNPRHEQPSDGAHAPYQPESPLRPGSYMADYGFTSRR